jgi:hypothetical protein
MSGYKEKTQLHTIKVDRPRIRSNSLIMAQQPMTVECRDDNVILVQLKNVSQLTIDQELHAGREPG